MYVIELSNVTLDREIKFFDTDIFLFNMLMWATKSDSNRLLVWMVLIVAFI
jgi:hypothetical protein